MSKNKDMAFVPRLRFLEFMDDYSASFEYGNAIFEPINNKNHNSDLPILAVTQERGTYPRNMMDYNVSVSEKSLSSYKVVEIGDFIISLRSFEGGIEFSLFRGICSPAYIILRKKTEIVEQYYKYYFKTSNFIKDINRDLEGIRDGKMVSYSQFSDILLPKPCTKEQQKIADCLTSLDELLAAEVKKLELLKLHKKGLMQKMFPSDGKNVPQLRFDGYTDTWVQRKLGDEIKFVGGATPFKDNPEYWNGDIVWLSSQEIKGRYVKSGTYKITKKAVKDNATKIIKAGTPLIVTRSGILANRFPISIPKVDVAINQDIKALVYDVSKINTNFLVAGLQKNEDFILRSIVKSGTTVQSVNLSDFQKFEIGFPSIAEQTAIGNFFYNLDEIITAQAEKIDTLKQHKKGLMQGLFPTAQEVME